MHKYYLIPLHRLQVFAFYVVQRCVYISSASRFSRSSAMHKCLKNRITNHENWTEQVSIHACSEKSIAQRRAGNDSVTKALRTQKTELKSYEPRFWTFLAISWFIGGAFCRSVADFFPVIPSFTFETNYCLVELLSVRMSKMLEMILFMMHFIFYRPYVRTHIVSERALASSSSSRTTSFICLRGIVCTSADYRYFCLASSSLVSGLVSI